MLCVIAVLDSDLLQDTYEHRKINESLGFLHDFSIYFCMPRCCLLESSNYFKA